VVGVREMVPQETAIHGSKVPRNPSKGSKDKGDEPSCIAGESSHIPLVLTSKFRTSAEQSLMNDAP
jgi:hypothetical protein